MSEGILQSFLVRLGFEVDESAFSKLEHASGSAASKAALLGAAALAASAAVTKFISDIAEGLDDLQDVAERVNSTADEIDKLGYIASENDSSLQAVTSSLEALNKNAGDAAMGIGRAKIIFQKLGLSVKDSNGNLKSSSVLLEEVSEKIKGMDIGQQTSVLERLGIDRTLLKTLTNDTSELAAEYERIQKAAGLNMDKAAGEASGFQDTLIKLKFIMETLSRGIAANFIKRLDDSFKRLNEMMIVAMPRIIAAITPVIDTIMTMTEVAGALISRVTDGIGYAIDAFKDLNEETDGWAGYLAGALIAWKAFNLGVLATPIGAVMSLGVALLALYDDYMTWAEGGESAFDWGKWTESIKFATAELKILKEILSTIVGLIIGGGGILASLFNGREGSTLEAMSATLAGLKEHGANIQKIKSDYWSGIGLPVAPSAASVPSPANVTQHIETNIKVDGSSDANAVGRSVASEQNRVNAESFRHLKNNANANFRAGANRGVM